MTKKGRTPHPDQLALTQDPDYRRRQAECLEKSERRNLIRAVTLERVQRVATEMTAARWRNCVDVLLYVASLDWGRKFPMQRTIANAIARSTRTVKRAVADLVALEILASDRRGRTSNVYAIDYHRLALLGVDSRGQTGSLEGPSWPGEGANMAPRKGQVGPADNPHIGINPIQPSLTEGKRQRHGERRPTKRVDPRRGF